MFKLVFWKHGSSQIFTHCTGKFAECKRELLAFLSKDCNTCGTVQTFRQLERFAELNDLPLYLSPKKDYATFDIWHYAIVKIKKEQI